MKGLKNSGRAADNLAGNYRTQVSFIGSSTDVCNLGHQTRGKRYVQGRHRNYSKQLKLLQNVTQVSRLWADDRDVDETWSSICFLLCFQSKGTVLLITFSLPDSKSGISLHQVSQKAEHSHITHDISQHSHFWHFRDLECHPLFQLVWSCDLHKYDTSAQQGPHTHAHTERMPAQSCRHILTSWFRKTENNPVGPFPSLLCSFLYSFPFPRSSAPSLGTLGRRKAGQEVRQMEAGDTPASSQSQVCSCRNGVMEN